MKIKKAIITAAGYGTRFLPATKNVPKELIPVINKPTIHYIVEHCVKAGIEEIIIVTRTGNHTVEDYFDMSPALEHYLESHGKNEMLANIKQIHKMAKFTFTRQDYDLPYGNGGPLYSARHLIGDEPFLYLWGDDLLFGEDAGVPEVLRMYKEHQPDAVLMCQEVEEARIPKVGIVKIKDGTKNEVELIVEKPKLEEAPSNLGSISPYLFTPKIFEYLDPTKLHQNEFYVQPAIDGLAKNGRVLACVTKGQYLTTGDPLSYLKTTIEVALQRSDLREDFVDYLKKRLKDL